MGKDEYDRPFDKDDVIAMKGAAVALCIWGLTYLLHCAGLI